MAKKKPVLQTPIATTWDELHLLWNGCTRCPASTKRKGNIVMGYGPLNPKFMVIGQAPGKEEHLLGMPFQGNGGYYTRLALDIAGIAWEDVFFDNVLACFKTKPTKEQITPCRSRLTASIQIVKPKLIIALGAIASKWISDNNKPMGVLATSKGTWKNYKYFCTTHPLEPYRLPDPDSSERAMEKSRIEFRMLGDYAREIELLPPTLE